MVTPADIQGYIAQGLPCEHLSVDGDGAHVGEVAPGVAPLQPAGQS